MRASIVEVRATGLLVSVENSESGANEAWLPSEEWSSNPSEWDAAIVALEPGVELDVISLPIRADGQAVVSRRKYSLVAVDGSWTNTIREMRIIDLGRTLIRGTIGNDIPALAYREAYNEWMDSKELTQELSDHGVLSRGDRIRGFVKSTRSEPNSLDLDVCEYLQFRGKEVKREVRKILARSVNDLEEPQPPPLQKLRPKTAQAINPVFLVDDNSACRESIASTLRREGVEVCAVGNAKEACDFLAESSKFTPSNPFKLAIVDPNLELESTDLTGLQVAKTLLAEPTCRVILTTGEVTNVKKLRNWGDLKIHGYIEKPFTMECLLQSIEEACSIESGVPLEDWIRPAAITLLDDGRGESTSASDSGEVSLPEVLRTLGRLKDGTVIHLFAMHPRSFRARSLASFGDGLKWEALSGKIAKSVIKDTALGREAIVEPRARQNPSHLWTQQMMEYESFCGFPVSVKGGRLALVAFHRDADAFDSAFVAAVRLAAEQAGRAVERRALYESRRNEATHASFGMALASLAHELASALTALDGNLGMLENFTANPSESLSTESAAMQTLRGIRKNVVEIQDITRTLRGGSIRTRSEPVSIHDCLRKAASACKVIISDTIKNPERISIESEKAPIGHWKVALPAASLIIVFFNLYLNAAQQIDLASRVRGYGKIWSSLARYVDAAGKAFARVRVHDTGPGIHYDEWERVFEPGYSTKPDGSGLGLYICRHLLRDTSSTLKVTSSTIWDGTTFTVTLPLADENTGSSAQ